MITKFETYNERGFEYGDINLLNFVNGKRKRDIEKILKEKLIGSYVSFSNTTSSQLTYTTRLYNGFVEDLRYDIRKKIVHIKLIDKDISVSVPLDTDITINITRTEIEKYNL